MECACRPGKQRKVMLQARRPCCLPERLEERKRNEWRGARDQELGWRRKPICFSGRAVK
jgi:hypothetical protein